MDAAKRSRELFAQSDKDSSATLDKAELSSLLRSELKDVSLQMGDAAWEDFIADVISRGDKDANGTWDVDEFANFYTKCISSPEMMQRYEQKVLLRFQESSHRP